MSEQVRRECIQLWDKRVLTRVTVYEAPGRVIATAWELDGIVIEEEQASELMITEAISAN